MNIGSFEAAPSAIDNPDPVLHQKVVEQAEHLTEQEMENWFMLQGEWAQNCIQQWVETLRKQDASFNLTAAENEELLGNRVMQMSAWFRTTIMLDEAWQKRLLSWKDNKESIFKDLDALCPEDLKFVHLVSH